MPTEIRNRTAAGDVSAASGDHQHFVPTERTAERPAAERTAGRR